MESLERNHTTEDNVNDRNVDWSRFGLGNNDNQRVERRDNDGYEEFNPGMYQTGVNELFAQEYNSDPWWKSNFFLSQPVLFGTWDGVFTSCLINIFGVIVFLRSGWIVGQAGALNAVLIILSTVSIALVTVLSAVGICERCRVESGGVYFLLSHVLGSRFGGSIGLLYCFGQAVGCALNVLGFGESMAGLVGLQSAWVQRGFACAAVILLSVINVAGVKWVVKLQFVLLIILLLAGVDFIIGSFIHENVEVGFEGWLSGNLKNNTFSAYEDGYGWFTVFGVFFPTVTGVLAGINMSGDLRHPSTDIPNGTLAALGTGTFLYLCFSLFLAATCTRTALLTDFMIASTVSAFSVLLLAGLYVSSFSSCLGAMYGTPRVLQSIASQNVIPGMSCLQRGRNPSISESTSHLESSPSIEGNGSVVNDASVRRPNIHKKLGNWYSPLCNRWFSLLGALIKILIMFLVHWGYAIANIVVVFVVWSYVGHANPAVKPGVSAEFKFFEWLRNLLLRIMGRRVYDYEQIIVTSVHPGVETRSAQLNEENEDFASRRRYHQTATVTGHYVNVD
ncbi:solute carrier family 12 member 8 isoform X2 [Cephus cinctus]|uniref:Solute carrier family 12 member 9 n=1 Tax=Cephus cinctus TaxID=211228 RepID=A0AAJ7RPZ3_CEPCN|nr:solute carrier family 12 member 8 isoform X2 [Cephus cinctus]